MKAIVANPKKVTTLNPTVTFNEPISSSTLNELLNETSATLKDFEVKWVNQDGQWITGYFNNPEEVEVTKNQLIKAGKEKDLDFKGITSARITINNSEAAYDKLSNNKHVFLADITEAIIKEKNPQVKVRVPDLAWKLEEIN